MAFGGLSRCSLSALDDRFSLSLLSSVPSGPLSFLSSLRPYSMTDRAAETSFAD